MEKEALKKFLPLFIAAGVALIVVVMYSQSGRSSLDNNIRALEKTSTVEKVETKENSVVVKCKNGESYEIIYQEGQTTYEQLVYDRCGADGVMPAPNPDSV